ncbi:MAG: outer membrane protein assembly factor BamD [Proteobacteria bacterium]|nr:outer membrane protein assembly factor BamD [Pseudomonadota bacterium]
MRVRISPLFIGILLAALPVRAFSETESLNPGPRSAEEARFLFEEGQKAMKDQQFKQAIRSFKRLIERYPAENTVERSYGQLLDALHREGSFEDLIHYARELIQRKPGERLQNEALAHLSEGELALKRYLNARTFAAELLEHHPKPEQKALAHAVRFQSLLDDKQFREARAELDLLKDFLEKESNETWSKRIPGFTMSLSTRQCLVNHLLKDKLPEEPELLDYFSSKNLCFKSALPLAGAVADPGVLGEWCESFTFFNHELQKLRADSFLKDKIAKDLQSTFDFAKGLSPDLVKCYAPYKPEKSKKRHRRKAHPAPQGG